MSVVAVLQKYLFTTLLKKENQNVCAFHERKKKKKGMQLAAQRSIDLHVFCSFGSTQKKKKRARLLVPLSLDVGKWVVMCVCACRSILMQGGGIFSKAAMCVDNAKKLIKQSRHE